MTLWQAIKGWWLYLRVMKAADRCVDAEIRASESKSRLYDRIHECRSHPGGDRLIEGMDTVEKAMQTARSVRAINWLRGE